MIESNTHIRLVAAADRGRGGTEIWLLKRNKEGKTTGLTRKDVIVIETDPELLVARVKWKLGSYVVVSGHAPHGAHAAAHIDQWWSKLRQVLQDNVRTPQDEVILGLDANAHCEEEALPGFSVHGLESHTNRSGQHLQKLINDLELIVPSTFETWHCGETWTWTHGKGSRKARCDYIAVPLTWQTGDISSQPFFDLDAGTTTRDHTALLVKVQRTFVKPPRFRVNYDRSQIPKIAEQHFAKLGKQLQDSPWSRNVHQQAIDYATTIQQWLGQHAPSQPSRERVTYSEIHGNCVQPVLHWFA